MNDHAGMTQALEVLRTTFGFDDFRLHQRAVIEQVLGGGDAVVLMPTGGGKSLCYQIPAMVRPGVGVIISPLIALMQDQVSALIQLGVRAAVLNSTLTWEEASRVERAMLEGDLDLVYMAPERLMGERTLDLLGRAPLALFAIDEAHCVSQWGHDFRPEYLQLSVLEERFPGVPRLALTATADPPTRKDIVSRLKLSAARLFVSGFDRPNICYRVSTRDNAHESLHRFIHAHHRGDAGIVYCLSRAKTERTAAWLQERGLKALPYHAGMTKEDRRRNQERFIKEEGVIIVATIAFGMGIDKPNVRFVAHLNLPRSMEAYYQETGRAGRDGLPANAWMAYSLQDVILHRQMVDGSEADEAQKRIEHQKLGAMLGYCEVTSCRRQVLLRSLGEALPEPCGNCDTCMEPVDAFDGTVAAQKALSAVVRTGERFGVGYLVAVLTGKDDERIARFGHDRLPTYGVGEDMTGVEWRSVYRQLIAAGVLRVDLEGYGGLHLTPEAWPILRGDRAVELRKDKPRKQPKPKRRRGAVAASAELSSPEDEALFEALRAHRLSLAREHEVAPYVIFHDTTLLAMVEHRPADLEVMGTLNGVGVKKLERYGEGFLGVIRNHDPLTVTAD